MLQAPLCLFSFILAAQAAPAPDPPTDVVLTGIGARALQVQWSHSGNFGTADSGTDSDSGFHISLSSSVSTQNITLLDTRATSLVITGIGPYQYFSRPGVGFNVRVVALSRSSQSSPAVQSITLPLCPGVCNYRFFTHTDSSCSRCQCNMAYSGPDCSVPTYAPRAVVATFDPRVGLGDPEVTVNWEDPDVATLDGRRVSSYRVVITTLTSSRTALVNLTFPPSQTFHNSQIIRDSRFASAYMEFHFEVTVATVTDVTGDVAISQPLEIATHAPGPVVNLAGTLGAVFIVVSWDSPGFVTEYRVSVDLSPSLNIASTTLSADVTTYTTPSLMTSVPYDITVTPVNRFGLGSATTITVNTPNLGDLINSPQPATVTLHSIANFTCSAAGDILWEINNLQVSSTTSVNAFAAAGITVPLLTFGSSTVFINATARTHGASVRCLVVQGGVRIVNQSSIVALTVVCDAGSYGQNGSCSPCPQLSTSSINALTASDCLCLSGHEPVRSSCAPCLVRFYKDSISNTRCMECPELSTTTSEGSTSLSDCSLCRFTEGSYPDAPCYYFTDAPILTVVFLVSSTTMRGSFHVTWEPIPTSVMAPLNPDIPSAVSRLRITCISTGRGVIPMGYLYNQTHELHRGTRPRLLIFENQVFNLVEYKCWSQIEADVDAGTIVFGAPSEPIIGVTPATGDDLSLPQITSARAVNSTSIEVAFSMHQNLVDLVTRFELTHTGAANNGTVSLTPQAQGTRLVGGFNPDDVVRIRLQTVIGNGSSATTYYSAFSTVNISMQTTTQMPETTPPEMTTMPATPLETTATPPEVTSDGATDDTPSMATPTSQVMPPNISQVTVLSSTSVLVAWQPVSVASGYNLYLYREEVQVGDVIRVIGGAVAQQSITVRPFTEYTVRVAAVEGDGSEGGLSAPFSFNTPQGLPGPPENVMAVEISGGLIKISWSAPPMPNGIITGYIVSLVSEEGTITIDVDANIFSQLINQPSSSYTVMVQAENVAGKGQQAVVLPQVRLDDTTISTETASTESSGFDLIIPVAAGGGAALLLLVAIAVVITVLCCCCCCRRNPDKRRKEARIRDNSYIEGSYGMNKKRISATISSQLSSSSLPPPNSWTFQNPVAITTNPDPSSAESRLAVEYMQMTGLAGEGGDGRVGGEHKYEKIPATRRLSVPPPPVSGSIAVKVKKEATPADYDNERLYMEMEKIYFTDSEKANTLAAYEFDRDKLNIIEEIGTGEFGRVLKATAKGIIPGELSSTVAVKMLKDNATETTRKGFLSEAQLLAKFGSHANVMSLLKVVCKSSPMLVIIPYMPHGDLKHYLRKCKADKNLKMLVGTAEQLSIGEQIASGMAYLAARYFIHRDLAARNILVGDNNRVKISDFGLSRALAKDESYYKLGQVQKLPAKWMALESLLYRKFSTYSDVWSYGVVLWEIFSFGEAPYKDIKAMHITKYVQEGKRLPCPEGCPQDVYQVMVRCWQAKKEKRPTFTDLILKLKALAISHKRASTVVTNTAVADEYVKMDPL